MTLRERWGTLRPWTQREVIPVLLGLIWVTIGTSYCLDPLSMKATHALVMPLSLMPIQGWGSAFVFVGILAIVSSRWPPHQDTWGYVVLAASSAWWACSYLVGFIFTGGNGWTGFAVWFVLCALIWSVNTALESSKDK